MKNKYFNNAPFLNFGLFAKAMFSPGARVSTRFFNQAAQAGAPHNFKVAVNHAYLSRRYMSPCYLPPSYT